MQQNKEFDKPFEVKSFSSDEDSAILLTPLYIVLGAEKSELTKLIADINVNREYYYPSDDMNVIYLNSIDDMKFTNDTSFLDINYKFEGKSKYCFLNFESNDVFNEFIKYFNVYTNNSFNAVTMQCTLREAATYPVIMGLIVAIGGSLLTYIVNMFRDYEPDRTKVVQDFVYYFYKFCKIAGPIPVAIAAAIAFILCIVWFIKKIKNPPMKTLFKRR